MDRIALDYASSFSCVPLVIDESSRRLLIFEFDDFVATISKSHLDGELAFSLSKLHNPHLPTTHLWQQLLQRRWHDGVVEGAHTLGFDLEVVATQVAPLAVSACVTLALVARNLLRDLLADQLFDPVKADFVFADDLLTLEAGRRDFVLAISGGLIGDLAQRLVERESLGVLLARRERNLVVATLSSHDHHALEGEVEPAFGVVLLTQVADLAFDLGSRSVGSLLRVEPLLVLGLLAGLLVSALKLRFLAVFIHGELSRGYEWGSGDAAALGCHAI